MDGDDFESPNIEKRVQPKRLPGVISEDEDSGVRLSSKGTWWTSEKTKKKKGPKQPHTTKESSKEEDAIIDETD